MFNGGSLRKRGQCINGVLHLPCICWPWRTCHLPQWATLGTRTTSEAGLQHWSCRLPHPSTMQLVTALKAMAPLLPWCVQLPPTIPSPATPSGYRRMVQRFQQVGCRQHYCSCGPPTASSTAGSDAWHAHHTVASPSLL